MSRPIVIVNFKTYPQGTGEKAVELAKQCERAGKEYDLDIRVAVQATDIRDVVRAVKIPVYSQAVDPVPADRNTGALTAKAIKAAGAKGALLNHSERYMSTPAIKEAVALLKKEKLHACVCAESTGRLRELDELIKPDLFCVEPPELVAGDVSVSVAQPDVVAHAVQATSLPLLVGAGVKRYKDVEIALHMGAAGVLVSSGLVKAPHRDVAFQQLFSSHPYHRRDE